MSHSTPPVLLGCDFSSSPSRRKPIVLALGTLAGARVVLSRIVTFDTLAGFAEWLREPRPWVGGFDLPFGLPRELVQHLGWPTDWDACIRHYATLTRAEVRERFAAFCDARPVGAKFAHRATDGPAGSSPSMKWVNPPVAYMLHAGVPLLLEAGVHLPGLQPPPVAADPATLRVALEAYPGLLAREVLDGWSGTRTGVARRSYKSDDRARQTPERLIARKDLVTALENGLGPHGPLRLKLRLKLTHAQHDALVADASGDALDAVLCLVQAAWAWQQHLAGASHYGLPAGMDPLEGWILTAPHP
jgi:hypothetical protein